MRPFILAVCVSCATVPAAYAQMEDDPAKELFGRFLRFFVPEHAELFGKLGTPDEYEMPEVLPNGDILIRRKPKPLPPPQEGEIDL